MTKTAKIVSTSTESGTVALFEPTRIALEDYFDDDFYTCMNYLKEGRFILFGIGGDGGVSMRVEVVEHLPVLGGQSFEGRLEVISGKLFFADASFLPYDGQPFVPSADGEWIDISAGKYHYLVSAADDSSEYSLVCFLKPVESFENVGFAKSAIPQLEA